MIKPFVNGLWLVLALKSSFLALLSILCLTVRLTCPSFFWSSLGWANYCDTIPLYPSRYRSFSLSSMLPSEPNSFDVSCTEHRDVINASWWPVLTRNSSLKINNWNHGRPIPPALGHVIWAVTMNHRSPLARCQWDHAQCPVIPSWLGLQRYIVMVHVVALIRYWPCSIHSTFESSTPFDRVQFRVMDSLICRDSSSAMTIILETLILKGIVQDHNTRFAQR